MSKAEVLKLTDPTSAIYQLIQGQSAVHVLLISALRRLRMSELGVSALQSSALGRGFGVKSSGALGFSAAIE